MSSCSTCAYSKASKCEVLREKIKKNCFAWADEEEAKRRDDDCKKYSLLFGIGETEYTKKKEIRENNKCERGGRTVKEVLNTEFINLYNQGFNDYEIADKLSIARPAINCKTSCKLLQKKE